MTYTTKLQTRTATKIIAGIACASVLGIGLVASANASPAREDFRVEFSFYRNAPVQMTYNDFLRTAERACSVDYAVGNFSRVRFEQKKCEADLMDRAVAETNIPALIAYHSDQVASAPRTTISSSN